MSGQHATAQKNSEKNIKPFSGLITKTVGFQDQWKNTLNVAIKAPFSGVSKVILKDQMMPVDQLPPGAHTVTCSGTHVKQFFFTVSGETDQQISEGKAGGISFGRFNVLKEKIAEIIFLHKDGTEDVAW